MTDEYDPTPPISTGKDYHDQYHKSVNNPDCVWCDHLYGEFLDYQKSAAREAEEW